MKSKDPKKEPNSFQDLVNTLQRFEAIFQLIQTTIDEKTKKYYFDSLDSELALLDEVIQDIDKRGVRKVETNFSKAAKAYIQNQSQENFERLRQDIATLKEASNFPKNINR